MTATPRTVARRGWTALAAGGAVASLVACAHTRDLSPTSSGADFGASNPGPAPHQKTLSIASPVADLCADPRSRVVLDRDLPGLRTDPNFGMFKSMSLVELQRLSGGRLTPEEVEKVRADLAAALAAPSGS